MRNDIDIDRFVKKPGLLLQLCREVVESIDGEKRIFRCTKKPIQRPNPIR